MMIKEKESAMLKRLNILMIDDHPFIIEGYKNILLNHTENDYDLNITAVNTGDEVETVFKNRKENPPYHLALIDINIPKSTNGKIESGKDAALMVRRYFPKSKIIILTMHNEDGRIREILTDVNPEGFLVKSDLSSDGLTLAFDNILSGHTYYSTTVNDHFRKVRQNTFDLDRKNLKILYFLAQGVRTKNLPKHIGLSLSAIEKRKNHMKILFNIKKANDEMLISEARKKGFV